MSCWETEAKKRPTFTQLTRDFEELFNSDLQLKELLAKVQQPLNSQTPKVNLCANISIVH